MAARAGLSQTMVSRVWHAFGLQPHRAGTFKLSGDPAFVDKVRDVVGLYLRSPDRASGSRPKGTKAQMKAVKRC